MKSSKYEVDNTNIVEKLKDSEKPILEALNYRRTIRNFDINFKIPKEQLEQIINAGRNAPTACNSQPFDFLVVTNEKKLQEVADKVLETKEEENSYGKAGRKEYLKRKEKHGVENVVTCDAPVVILFVKNERKIPKYVDLDVGIASMAMMMAAIQFGYDSMCLGVLQNPVVEEYFNLPKGSLPMGLAIGKVKGDRTFPHKELISKVDYIE